MTILVSIEPQPSIITLSCTCGEPMLDGSYCGAYCVTSSCVNAHLKALSRAKPRRETR